MTPDVAAIAAGKRVLVCGGRNYGVGKPAEWGFMYRTLNALHERHRFGLVIEGGAPGADAGGRAFADINNIPAERFSADWNAHGKAAGPIRNQHMIDEGKPDLVIAFPGGPGTADMVRRAKAAGLHVIEIGEP